MKTSATSKITVQIGEEAFILTIEEAESLYENLGMALGKPSRPISPEPNWPNPVYPQTDNPWIIPGPDYPSAPKIWCQNNQHLGSLCVSQDKI